MTWGNKVLGEVGVGHRIHPIISVLSTHDSTRNPTEFVCHEMCSVWFLFGTVVPVGAIVLAEKWTAQLDRVRKFDARVPMIYTYRYSVVK